MKKIFLLFFMMAVSFHANSWSEDDIKQQLIKNNTTCLKSKGVINNDPEFARKFMECDIYAKGRVIADINFYECIGEQIMLIDNGISPENEIANAVKNKCPNEYKKVCELAAPGRHETCEQLRWKITEGEAIKIVNEIRKQKKSYNPSNYRSM